MMRFHSGGCHCGRVRYRVAVDLSTPGAVVDCNCSICQKKGYLHIIVPGDAFELVSGEEDLATYRFHTGVAKHHFCRICGVHSFYVPRSDPDKVDVNARSLDAVDLAALVVGKFDGRNWEAAMAQRETPPGRDLLT
jgi:hypothetical protein